jgi:hypothetical protein
VNFNVCNEVNRPADLFSTSQENSVLVLDLPLPIKKGGYHVNIETLLER